MKINFKIKMLVCFIILLIYTFLFPLNNVLAENITINDSTKVLHVEHNKTATEGFCFVENDILAVCDTVITRNKSNDYAYVYLYTYDFGHGFSSSKSTRLNSSAIVNKTHSNSMTYDPQNKKLIIASEGMHVYSVDLQNNKILNDEQIVGNLKGHAVGYDSAKNKIITYNGYYVRSYELSDFYSGNKNKAVEKVYPKKANASSQGLGAFGGLAFLIFSNMSGNRYIGNTIVVYDYENGKVVTSLESNYIHEFEDCMCDSSGNLYISDTMGNLFKPGINAYSIGANGSVTNPSTQQNNSKSVFDYLMEFVAFLFNTLSDLAQAVIECIECNKPLLSSFKLTYSPSELEANVALNNDPQYKQNVSSTNPEEEQQEGEEEENETTTLAETTIPSTIQDKLGNTQTVFNMNTPIPVIKVSLENLVTNTLNVLDIDFYDTHKYNPNTMWVFYRKIVTIASHSTIYICAAVLIIMLIIRSILLIWSTIRGLPNGAKRSKKIMDNLLGAIAVFTGIFVIMTICVYLNKLLINIILGEIKTNYLIRINVENICSFNSNFIGYLKYRSQSANIMDAAKWSVFRFIITAETFILFFIMIIRMVVIGALTVIAPITAITFMRERNVQNEQNQQSVLYIRPFIQLYVRLALVPVIATAILYILLKI